MLVPLATLPGPAAALKNTFVDKARAEERELQAPDDPTIVYARWAGCVGGRARQTAPREKKKHIYSSAIPPERPLRLGMRVRILAMTPAWYSTPEDGPEKYDTYDAHIVGVVVGIAGWKDRKVVLEIKNECSVNDVESVKLRVPFVPEVTVQLEADSIPRGQREAQEADLNTYAVISACPGESRCGGSACWLPWRRLVGEAFIWEPMAEDVSERPGIKPGRKRVPLSHFAGWGKTAAAESEKF